MQSKHLIIFALIGIVALVVFNVLNSSNRELEAEAAIEATQVEVPVIAESYIGTEDDTNISNVANKPLGQQPKALLDNVNTTIDQAQQGEQQQFEQMDEAQ